MTTTRQISQRLIWTFQSPAFECEYCTIPTFGLLMVAVPGYTHNDTIPCCRVCMYDIDKSPDRYTTWADSWRGCVTWPQYLALVQHN